MSKTVSAELKTHLAGEVLTVAYLFRVTRADDVVMGFTSHDVDITYDGQEYEADTGHVPSDVSQSSNLSTDNMSVLAFLDSSKIDEDDLFAGLYDGSNLDVYLVNYEDLTMGDVTIAEDWELGNITVKDNIFEVEVLSKSRKLNQRITPLVSTTCRAILGDSKCQIPIDYDEVVRDTAYILNDLISVDHGSDDHKGKYYTCTTAGTTAGSQPSYTTTDDDTTTDGTAIFTCHPAWLRWGEVDAVTDNRIFTVLIDNFDSRAVDDWYNLGKIVWETGDNDTFTMEIKDWVFSTKEVTLYMAMGYTISPGDRFKIVPGCVKSLATCRDDYDNVVNFRGEPYTTGTDKLNEHSSH